MYKFVLLAYIFLFMTFPVFGQQRYARPYYTPYRTVPIVPPYRYYNPQLQIQLMNMQNQMILQDAMLRQQYMVLMQERVWTERVYLQYLRWRYMYYGW